MQSLYDYEFLALEVTAHKRYIAVGTIIWLSWQHRCFHSGYIYLIHGTKLKLNHISFSDCTVHMWTSPLTWTWLNLISVLIQLWIRKWELNIKTASIQYVQNVIFQNIPNLKIFIFRYLLYGLYGCSYACKADRVLQPAGPNFHFVILCRSNLTDIASTAGNEYFLPHSYASHLSARIWYGWLTAQEWLTNSRAEIMSGLTSAGAVLDLVVEKLGDEDQVCEDVEHHCDYLREGHGGGGQKTQLS